MTIASVDLVYFNDRPLFHKVNYGCCTSLRVRILRQLRLRLINCNYIVYADIIMKYFVFCTRLRSLP